MDKEEKDDKKINIRLGSSDTKILRFKEITKIKKSSLTQYIKYVLVCAILDQPPVRIGKVHDLEYTDVKTATITINIKKDEYNGILYNWYLNCSKATTVKVSSYIKALLKYSIDTVSLNEEETVTDIFWEHLKLAKQDSKIFKPINSNGTMQVYEVPIKENKMLDNTEESVPVTEQYNVDQDNEVKKDVKEEIKKDIKEDEAINFKQDIAEEVSGFISTAIKTY